MPLPNGDLIAQSDYGRMQKLDCDSNQLWEYSGINTHHDFDIAEDGRIYVLGGKNFKKHPRFPSPLIEDFLVELDPNGKELRRVSFLDALAKSDYANIYAELRNYQVRAKAKMKFDVTHLNTLEILADHEGLPAGFEAGRMLVSAPLINRLFTVDFETGRVAWAARGAYRRQHHPTISRENELLVFDNYGAGKNARGS